MQRWTLAFPGGTPFPRSVGSYRWEQDRGKAAKWEMLVERLPEIGLWPCLVFPEAGQEVASWPKIVGVAELWWQVTHIWSQAVSFEVCRPLQLCCLGLFLNGGYKRQKNLLVQIGSQAECSFSSASESPKFHIKKQSIYIYAGAPVTYMMEGSLLDLFNG